MWGSTTLNIVKNTILVTNITKPFVHKIIKFVVKMKKTPKSFDQFECFSYKKIITKCLVAINIKIKHACQ